LLGGLSLLPLPAVLAGCGWEPLYADPQTSRAAAELRAVKVMPIPERIGQVLSTGLINSFNPDHIETRPLYRLVVILTSQLQDLGIQSTGLATRGEVQMYANYQLIENAGSKIAQSASIHASDSFDIEANGYSTVVALDDAKLRCVEELRREIIARLTLFLQNKIPAST
jgi:LPS-assembly lipoprotein